MDQGLLREHRFKNRDFTGERPHEVWRRQFHATIEDDRPAVLTREIIGVDNLMWGSDYPHVGFHLALLHGRARRDFRGGAGSGSAEDHARQREGAVRHLNNTGGTA